MFITGRGRQIVMTARDQSRLKLELDRHFGWGGRAFCWYIGGQPPLQVQVTVVGVSLGKERAYPVSQLKKN